MASKNLIRQKVGEKDLKLEQPTVPPTQLTCPKCGSSDVDKNAFRYVKNDRVQRYLCNFCGYRFSKTESLKGISDNNAERRISVSLAEGTKNLVKVETQKGTAQWESTNHDKQIKETLFEYSWNLKRDGYRESTNRTYTYLIKLFITRGADLHNPDSIKDFIAKQEKWSNGRKRNACKAYDHYVKLHGLMWKKPKYKEIDKPPFIPTEEEIDALISSCSEQMATYLQVLKESGARREEGFILTWEDIDFVTNVIRVTPVKDSNARTFLMSNKLVNMLSNLPKTSSKVWVYKNLFYLDKGFRRMRKRAAHKLGNPRLKRIHFHTFRYFRAKVAYEYSKGDLTYVQEILGHKNIENTRRYTRHFKTYHRDEKFIVKVARNVKEAAELIENGYDYVTGEYIDGGKLFRKQKRSFLGSSSTSEGSWSSMD